MHIVSITFIYVSGIEIKKTMRRHRLFLIICKKKIFNAVGFQKKKFGIYNAQAIEKTTMP